MAVAHWAARALSCGDSDYGKDDARRSELFAEVTSPCLTTTPA
jgi:hypothetical protein